LLGYPVELAPGLPQRGLGRVVDVPPVGSDSPSLVILVGDPHEVPAAEGAIGPPIDVDTLLTVWSKQDDVIDFLIGVGEVDPWLGHWDDLSNGVKRATEHR